MGRVLLFVAFASVILVGSLCSAYQVDPDLPEYVTVSGVSGSLKSVGSDTMNNAMALWAEGFRSLYPNVKIAVEGKGSSTAPTALIEGTAQFGPMSREMKSNEIDAFEKKFGYKPAVIRVAVDALAVFVNRDNPLKCLTLKQLDAIFSPTRKGGFAKDIRSWGDLGLAGDWANKRISVYGRNSASGTYGYFKEAALFQGDFKNSVKEQPGSSAVVQAIATDKYAIGYSGIGYKTPDVKLIPLAIEEGKCFEANPENTYEGEYPLARFMYVYFNKNPNDRLNPLMAEFIKYLLSRDGQTAVIRDGFYPVSRVLADEDLRSIGIK
ncbi:MAG: phosphate ABC transporter substrate-binding protein [Desulfomonile tiedjei]|uniref:Phosphate-binding protein n=1 Tax=Desulfomonile tiedjei TaxID=2358 RepID=A0A9D6V4I8_9BACT|nr:phosphate ABC transporter substrate-binding protein [Desulfomonile tiedjei]